MSLECAKGLCCVDKQVDVDLVFFLSPVPPWEIVPKLHVLYEVILLSGTLNKKKAFKAFFLFLPFD